MNPPTQTAGFIPFFVSQSMGTDGVNARLRVGSGRSSRIRCLDREGRFRVEQGEEMAWRNGALIAPQFEGRLSRGARVESRRLSGWTGFGCTLNDPRSLRFWRGGRDRFLPIGIRAIGPDFVPSFGTVMLPGQRSSPQSPLHMHRTHVRPVWNLPSPTSRRVVVQRASPLPRDWPHRLWPRFIFRPRVGRRSFDGVAKTVGSRHPDEPVGFSRNRRVVWSDPVRPLRRARRL